MSRRALALESINTLIFVFTILGTNLIDLFGLKIGQRDKAIASALLIIIYIVVVWRKRFEKIHSFQENSRQFSKFFERWYSKNGKLMIFCTDLDWLDRPGHAGVVGALRQKGDKLHLYLRNKANDHISQTLIAGGAKLYNVKDKIRTSHRLSILDNEGIQSIIIRNKDISSDDIVFVETDSYRDPYIIGLSLDMLEDCYESPT